MLVLLFLQQVCQECGLSFRLLLFQVLLYIQYILCACYLLLCMLHLCQQSSRLRCEQAFQQLFVLQELCHIQSNAYLLLDLLLCRLLLLLHQQLRCEQILHSSLLRLRWSGIHLLQSCCLRLLVRLLYRMDRSCRTYHP